MASRVQVVQRQGWLPRCRHMIRILLLFTTLASSAWSVSGDNGLATDPGNTIRTLEELKNQLNEQAYPSRKTGEPSRHMHDPERAANGKSLYRIHCSRCHGENAQGTENWDQRDPSGNFPPPPLDGSAHTWHHPEAQLITIIQTGSGGMPPFSEVLEPHEIGDVIVWLQSFWPDDLYQVWLKQNELFQKPED